MGFYNIYKIIKDMLRTIFGNKILKAIIITLLIFIILTIKENCFALSTIPPITVDGVTFDFSSTIVPSQTWSSDDPVFTGDMDNITILRYERINNQYDYMFLRSSYPIYITTQTDPNHTLYDFVYYNSYDNQNNKTYYMYNSVYKNRSLTSISAGTPNYSNNLYISTYNSRDDLSTLTVLYSNKDVYYNNTPIYSTFTSPSLGNTQTQLENLSFTNFVINTNSFTQTMIDNPDEPLVMLFYNRSLSNSSNTDGLYPIKEKYFYKESIYFDSTNSTDTNYIFNYPIFRTGVFFNIGSTYEIKLAKRVYIEEYNTWGYDFFDNSYVFTVSSNVTQDYINQLNQQTATSTDEDNQQQINNALNEQTNAINNQTHSIDNINNSITDSNVDNSSIDLPTDNTTNPTQDGINNIFQIIYNGFTSGTPQDIVFPLPYSTQNITIKPNYVSQMLNSSERRKNCLFSYSSLLLVHN